MINIRSRHPDVTKCRSCGWAHTDLDLIISSGSGFYYICPMTQAKVFMNGTVLPTKNRHGSLISAGELIAMNESENSSDYLANVKHMRYNTNIGGEQVELRHEEPTTVSSISEPVTISRYRSDSEADSGGILPPAD